MSVREFVDAEVDERGNYSLRQVHSWMKRYGLTLDSQVIWVTRNKRIANSYSLPAETDWKTVPEGEISVCEFTEDSGTLIPESDDGREGFLLALNPQN